MNRGLTLALIVVWVGTFVAGQFLLKSALDKAVQRPAGRRAALFTAAITIMSFCYFLEFRLLEKLDVSYLFPFQGLSVLIIALGAALFLKERLTAPLVIGSLLIAAGVMLVGAS